MESSITQYLSQIRINWVGCSRKGIWHKNAGNDGCRGMGDPNELASSWMSLWMLLLASLAQNKTRNTCRQDCNHCSEPWFANCRWLSPGAHRQAASTWLPCVPVTYFLLLAHPGCSQSEGPLHSRGCHTVHCCQIYGPTTGLNKLIIMAFPRSKGSPLVAFYN